MGGRPSWGLGWERAIGPHRGQCYGAGRGREYRERGCRAGAARWPGVGPPRSCTTPGPAPPPVLQQRHPRRHHTGTTAAPRPYSSATPATIIAAPVSRRGVSRSTPRRKIAVKITAKSGALELSG